MAAKVNNFSELGNILSDKMRIASSISKLHGIFRIPQIVHGLGMEKEKGVQADGKPRCLIVDDTVLEKTGAHNRMEHISRVYDHGRHIHVLGFKLQLVVYFDGVTPIPVDFSIHCEWRKKKDCGLTKKDREARFTKDRAEGTSGRERSDEALQEKPRIFMKMLAKLWRRGLRPQYVLYDS